MTETTPKSTDALRQFVRAHQEAAEAIVAEVKRLFPIGTHIDVLIHQKWIRAEVTGHGESWWYQPGSLILRNLKTQRQRKVTVSTLADGDYAIIESPVKKLPASLKTHRLNTHSTPAPLP